MAAKRKSTREKMNKPAELVDVPAVWEKRYGRGKMLIPSPLDLEALVKKIPRGRVVTQRELGDEMAREAGAAASCPITTGIFLRLVAQASEEEAAAGKKRTAPWWRVVRSDGGLWDKAPGGIVEQANRLKAEGVAVVVAGRGKPRVSLGSDRS